MLKKFQAGKLFAFWQRFLKIVLILILQSWHYSYSSKKKRNGETVHLSQCLPCHHDIETPHVFLSIKPCGGGGGAPAVHRLKTHTCLLHSSLPAPVLNSRLKHSMRWFCACETQDILPEGAYHYFPLKTVINEPIQTHFPRGNYVRFTWDILTRRSPPAPHHRESAYRLNIVCDYMDLSATLCISGDHVNSVQLKAGLVDKLTTGGEDLHFLHSLLALGGRLELSGHNWLTHTELIKEEKATVVVSGFFSSSVILVLAMHLVGSLILWALKRKA